MFKSIYLPGGGSSSILSGALGEIAVTGSIEFAKDAEPNAGHLVSTNSDLILSSSTSNISVSGNLGLPTGGKLLFDSPTGNDYLTGEGGSAVSLYVQGALVNKAFSSAEYRYKKQIITNNTKLAIGNAEEYWQIYDTTNTAFELWSTDVDGGGTDGKVLWIEDGTDDVNFSGTIIPAEISLINDKNIYFGSNNQYWQKYNSSEIAFELHSSDNGGASPGLVFWNENGTANLQVSGALQTVGQDVATVSTGSYEPGSIRYVTDGNAGSPCLAVYHSGDWYRIALGAIISDA